MEPFKPTSKEIDTIIEALEVWEKGDFLTPVITTMIKWLVIPKNASPELLAEFEDKQREEHRRIETETSLRKEVSILLKAKLIGAKHEGNIIDAIHPPGTF